jgi:hypothetical protein
MVMSQELGEILQNSRKRYLDECYIFWGKYSEEDLMKFHNLLNKTNPIIQFIIEYSNTSISILDFKVTKDETKILTDVFYKATDAHQHLNIREDAG